MHHRHLLPTEIDLLLDGEVGFGVAPLREHVEACDECRREFETARSVIGTLDTLPRFAPAPSFADRVMNGVQIVEPWHVAIADTARRLVPRSAPLRVVMATTAGLIGIALSSAAVWLAFRTDVALYAGGLIADRLRQTVGGALTAVGRDLLGPGASDAVAAWGPGAIGAGVAIVVTTAIATAVALRAAAASARRARE